MKYFDIDIELKPKDKQWIYKVGNNITEPAWTIRPYKLTSAEMDRLSYAFPLQPEYAAIIMVPANTICKTHVDDKANKNGERQRITAINIPVAVHKTSVFQYMQSLDSDVVLETVDLQSAKCWRVDIPHRVDNSQSPHNRVVLSLSYTESVQELYARL